MWNNFSLYLSFDSQNILRTFQNIISFPLRKLQDCNTSVCLSLPEPDRDTKADVEAKVKRSQPLRNLVKIDSK
jgi:hypothetical protein